MKYQQSHQEATNTTTSLQETIRTLNATINENATRIRQLESDLEASTKELYITKRDYEHEKCTRVSIEAAKQLTSKEMENALNSCMTELGDLKIQYQAATAQLIQKDVSFKD